MVTRDRKTVILPREISCGYGVWPEGALQVETFASVSEAEGLFHSDQRFAPSERRVMALGALRVLFRV